jgi:hypothetical protein
MALLMAFGCDGVGAISLWHRHPSLHTLRMPIETAHND